MPRQKKSSGDEGSGPVDGSEPRFLVVGQVLAPFGVRGGVKVEVLTDFPERLKELHTVYLGDKLTPFEVRHVDLRINGRQAIFFFQGYDTPEAVASLHEKMIAIPVEEAVPLEEGQYYVHQIVGLTVQADTGETLGVLTDVLFTGSNDVYVVVKEGHELLIPALDDVILDVDLAARTMRVHLPPGLLD
jgi:16S rRNA processing protein RimM